MVPRTEPVASVSGALALSAIVTALSLKQVLAPVASVQTVPAGTVQVVGVAATQPFVPATSVKTPAAQLKVAEPVSGAVVSLRTIWLPSEIMTAASLVQLTVPAALAQLVPAGTAQEMGVGGGVIDTDGEGEGDEEGDGAGAVELVTYALDEYEGAQF